MYFATYKGRWIEHVAVVLLVCLSGNDAFTRIAIADQLSIATVVFLIVLLLMRKKAPLSLSFCLVVFIFAIILLIQSVSFAFLPVVTIAGFLIRLSIGYGTVTLVEDFPRTYVDVLFYTCILSLCFYLPELLFNILGYDFQSLFSPLNTLLRQYGATDYFYYENHVVFYNFEATWKNPGEVYRNAGMFWEPGAFAGYIVIAVTFLAFRKGSYAKRSYVIRLLVLTATMLTTLSTMGLATLPFALALHYRLLGRTLAGRLGWISATVLALPLLVYGANIVWNLEYMKPKIENQYERAISRGQRWEATRLGAVIVHWEYIKRRPILGWGLHDKTRFALHRGEAPRGGLANGFTGFIHEFGLAGMGIFIFFGWKGLYLLSGGNYLRSSLAMLVILLSLQSEPFLNYPLYLGLMFLRKIPEGKRREVGESTDATHLGTNRHSSLGNTGAIRY